MSIPTPRESLGRMPTWDEEAAWLNELVADSGRATKVVVGTTVGGRPVNMIGIGYPGPPPVPDGGPGTAPGALIIAFQHGMEPASREAAFQVIRDLAYTEDSALRAHLAGRPVWVIPSANADRAPHVLIGDGGRVTLDGVDMNRDHIPLAAQETRALQDAIRRTRAEVVIDLHEGASDPNDVEVGGPTNPQVMPQVRGHSDALVTAMRTALTTAGYVAGEWNSYTWPSMLRNTSAMRHALTAIVETRTQSRPTVMRIAMAAEACAAAIAYYRVNAATIRADLTQARLDAQERGRTRASFSITGETANSTVNPAPLAYRLTAEQAGVAADHLGVFGVTAQLDGSAWLVLMEQDAQPVIPYLLDGASQYAVVSAERVADLDPPTPPPQLVPAFEPSTWGPLRIGGVTVDVTSVEVYRQ